LGFYNVRKRFFLIKTQIFLYTRRTSKRDVAWNAVMGINIDLFLIKIGSFHFRGPKDRHMIAQGWTRAAREPWVKTKKDRVLKGRHNEHTHHDLCSCRCNEAI